MIKRLGDELSIAAPERAKLYESKISEHAQTVEQLLKAADDSAIFSKLVGGYYDGWNFEFGQLREASRGRIPSSDGVVSLPFRVSVYNQQSGQQRIIDMTLYFTVDHAGQLRTTGVR